MGFLRGAGLVIVSVLLFVSLIGSGIFLTLGMSLTYDNTNQKISSIATDIIQGQIGEGQIEQYLPLMKAYCEQNPDYVFNEQGYTFVLSCDNIPSSTGELIKETTSSLVEGFYYKDYQCKMWDCLQEEDIPLFLVSEHARDYWMSKFYTSLIISLILIALLILLAQKKSNGIILTGSLTFVASLIISKLNTIGTKIVEALMGPVAGALSGDIHQEMLSDVVGIFFSESSRVFIWMLVIGLLLVVVGIVLRIMRVGFKIADKIERIQGKDEKNKLKKEVKELKDKLLKNTLRAYPDKSSKKISTEGKKNSKKENSVTKEKDKKKK
jgi:hypothetical protein